VRLERLGIEPSLREELKRLGIQTVGAFLQLPADGVLRRFGTEAHRLHLQAMEDLSVPLQPLEAGEPLVTGMDFETPEQDAARLLFFLKGMLHPLLKQLEARGQALSELRLRLEPETGRPRVEALRPAVPTLEPLLLLELVRLRLDALELKAPLIGLRLGVRGALLAPEQLRLFDEPPRRDRAAAGRALARIRAELGEGAVVRAALKEGHLPEASFVWQPMDQLPEAEPSRIAEPPLVRRLLAPPRELRPEESELEAGPFVVSGGWWVREVHREYYFLEKHTGEIWWVYYDRKRKRWFLQATVD
jgi:protein ImuB